MTIILPKEIAGIGAVEENLPAILAEVMTSANCRTQKLQLYLPKFKVKKWDSRRDTEVPP